MKASEAFNEIGMVCRDPVRKITAIRTGETVRGFLDDGDGWTGDLNSLFGDWWKRVGNIRDLLPAVPIEELPVHRLSFPIGIGNPLGKQSEPFVMLDDLQSIVPTRACDCSAKVRELESNMEGAKDYGNRLLAQVDEWSRKYHALQSELATLREQLAGWVPCNLEDISVGDFFLVYQYDAKRWSVGLRDMESMVSHPDSVYYKLPTLPQPEVPAVPLKQKLDSMFKQVLDEVFPEEPSDE